MSCLSLGPSLASSKWLDPKESLIDELNAWFPRVGGEEGWASTAVGTDKGILWSNVLQRTSQIRDSATSISILSGWAMPPLQRSWYLLDVRLLFVTCYIGVGGCIYVHLWGKLGEASRGLSGWGSIYSWVAPSRRNTMQVTDVIYNFLVLKFER